ncbi:RNA polymerase sigma factor [Gimesia aquarii]|uniref:RNA polymerase sigma factor SigM n=1 Tax=Gimesia aquarii TaxID=2527964 RepID=A0A517VNR2_9PLAN|nr:RNA polymerase sigma factor [Gimesia aquarii]QDT94613.1 RNA polymerase sigma factor SigM [Gimesia aquarii]
MHASSDIPADSDSTLVVAILGGEQSRFAELVERYQKMVYGVAWSQLGNRDLAEEAAQQTFVKAYCYLATLRDTNKFRPWLAQIARNISVSLGRKRSKELSNSDRWDLLPAEKEENSSNELPDLKHELRETFGDLKNDHRQILTLFYLEGRNIKELSATLALSESAVKTRLSRARKALRGELEKRMGNTLDDLTPAHSLVPLVMSGLPTAAPLGATTKLATLGKTSGYLTKLGAFAWLNLLSSIPFFFLMYHYSKRQAETYQDGKEHDFRRKIILQHPLNVFLLFIIINLVVALMILQGFSFHTLFQLLCLLCLFGVWQGLQLLKVNRSEYAQAQVIVPALQLLAFFLIGFFQFHFVTFLAAMTLANLVLYRASDSMPFRMDYNLFLRAATDGLSIIETKMDDQHEFSRSKLEQFAKFLGSHWLIRDYQLTNRHLELFLPHAKPRILQEWIPSQFYSSRVVIDQQGHCEAFMHAKDAKAIKELTKNESTPAMLTEKVQEALEFSLRQFDSGKLELAIDTLCQIHEDQVFKKKESKAIAFKMIGKIGIGAGILAVVMFIIAWYFGEGSFF